MATIHLCTLESELRLLYLSAKIKIIIECDYTQNQYVCFLSLFFLLYESCWCQCRAMHNLLQFH